MPFYLGISGWSYRDWLGHFYPRGTKPAGYLPYYATRFNAVEINSTFYRIPTPESVARWREAVPSGFRFAAKVPRVLTHYKRLRGGEDELAAFARAINELGDRRGPLLTQLPPTLTRDDSLLGAFLDRLKKTLPVWELAVEFRHETWLDPEVYAMLDARCVAVCVQDMPRCTVETPQRDGHVFMRRHGPSGDYKGRYTDEFLAADAARISRWLDAGREVWCFYNHGLGGHAISDAERLNEKLNASAGRL